MKTSRFSLKFTLLAVLPMLTAPVTLPSVKKTKEETIKISEEFFSEEFFKKITCKNKWDAVVEKGSEEAKKWWKEQQNQNVTSDFPTPDEEINLDDIFDPDNNTDWSMDLHDQQQTQQEQAANNWYFRLDLPETFGQ